ncbi:MAG: class II fructose-bisphosphate aldolase [Bacteroidetes bacterium]|nr:class II fructose-bisphosphate aldolase [Bacteroidota bacterium]MCL5738558.1 class II fructose-bisphosphate aldolase [Bacteroidota bacterium]
MIKNVDELKNTLQGVVEVDGWQKIKVTNAEKLRSSVIDTLVYESVFNPSEEVKTKTRWLIRKLARSLGSGSASIQGLYSAFGQGEVSGFTVPAVNIRGITYDFARAMFRVAKRNNIGPFVFEIAKSEIGYTGQRPAEYSACVLAAAVKENYSGPVFIQGDHFQFNAKKFAQDPQKEIDTIKSLIKEAIEAEFYNIDIDSSTLVDLSKKTTDEQQRNNYELAAEMTALIRELEPKDVTISVGGEIGEVGGKNSTPEEFHAYMQGYMKTLNSKKHGAKPISKISVQTGSSHGGVPLPDGTVAQVKIDFGVLEAISKIARKEYGMAGAVQHGASTLPEELFDKFPGVGTAEIHLATGFQNLLYDVFPKDFRGTIYDYLRKNFADEKKPDMTDEQFIYKTRKKGFGPFKEQMWNLGKEWLKMADTELEKRIEFLFLKLNTKNTKDIVNKYVKV